MVNYTKPFSPVDHVGPQPVIKEQVQKDVIPPAMVCSCPAVVTTVYIKYVGMVSSLDIWMVGTRVNKLLDRKSVV